MTIIAPQTIWLAPGSHMPNNPDLPVLVYRAVLDDRTADKAAIFTQRFGEHNWHGIWKADIYDYDHYHSASHEVLGFARGQAKLQLGGDEGKAVDLNPGDLLILPAGTGHRKISGSDALTVIGAYPAGQENYDICRSIGDCPGALERIANTAVPDIHPFYGSPIVDWQKNN